MNSANPFKVVRRVGLWSQSSPGTIRRDVSLTRYIATFDGTVVRKKTDMITTLKPQRQRDSFPAAGSPPREATLIYVVDDQEALAELYTIFLEAIGYNVRSFTDRADALAALLMEPAKPDLLITDYLGLSMPVDDFIRHCRVAHPELRILMASGCHGSDAGFVNPLPDRFIQKPFTAEELRREVQAALCA